MMTDSQEIVAEDAALAIAGKRLDAALARLEAGMNGLARRAEDGGAANPAPREAALEAALKEASETMGALIAEVREAIRSAETAGETAAGEEAADGQG